MKSYLDACGVPTTRVGHAELPRLIMGIHPYDGCSYQDKQRDADNLQAFGRVAGVVEVLRHAVEEGITVAQVDHMIPDLNRLHLQAIWETQRLTGVQIGLLAYILIPVTLNGEMVTSSERAYSTFYACDEEAGGAAFREQLARDEILRYTLGGSMDNLGTPDKVPPYGSEDAA